MTKFNFGLPSSVIDSVKNIIEAKKMKGVCPKCGKSPCQCESMKEELNGNQEIEEKAKWRAHAAARVDNPKYDSEIPPHDIDYAGGKYTSKADEPHPSGSLHRRLPSEYGTAQKGERKGMITKAHTARLKDRIKLMQGKHTTPNLPEEKWEGSKKDNEEDKKMAKKAGMTHAEWEKSAADKKHDKMHKEEVEQIDEISQETKDAYIRKADKQVARTNLGYGKRHGGLGTKGVSVDDFKRKYQNRKAGIKQAMEEVELSAEELARIEEINKGL